MSTESSADADIARGASPLDSEVQNSAFSILAMHRCSQNRVQTSPNFLCMSPLTWVGPPTATFSTLCTSGFVYDDIFSIIGFMVQATQVSEVQINSPEGSSGRRTEYDVCRCLIDCCHR